MQEKILTIFKAVRLPYAILIVLLLVAIYWFGIHPWMTNWGSTVAEQQMALPGDACRRSTPPCWADGSAHPPRHLRVHANIVKAAPVPGERLLGRCAHYAIGIAFAALLLGIWGLDWARSPTLPPALAVGLATVAAPVLVLQPALGAGIASSKAKNPSAVRLRSVLTHTVHGLGLYASARFWAALIP